MAWGPCATLYLFFTRFDLLPCHPAAVPDAGLLYVSVSAKMLHSTRGAVGVLCRWLHYGEGVHTGCTALWRVCKRHSRPLPLCAGKLQLPLPSPGQV